MKEMSNDDYHPEPVSWRRRIAMMLGGLVALVLVAHLAWTMVAVGNLRKRVAQLRAQGEPVLPADFMSPAAADEADNGGADVDAAVELAAAYRAAHAQFDELEAALPLRPEERQVIEAAVQADLGGALSLLDRARAKPRLETRLDLTSPVFNNLMLTSMNDQRGLVRALGAASLLDHANGDHAAALARLDRVLFVSRYLYKHPTIVGHLVAVGSSALASQHAIELAPDLRIGTGKGDVPPEELRKLIDVLLDDAPYQAGLRLAFRGERMAQLDAMSALDTGIPIAIGLTPGGGKTRYNAAMRYAIRPVLQTNARFMLDQMTVMLAAADGADLPAAQAKLPTRPPRGTNPLRVFADILLPALPRVLETHHRERSERRLAAAALAVRWYAVEHEGRLPGRLDDLVPRYLPAVPVDPLIGGGARISYKPAATQPILYGVGTNNVDDGGSEAFIKPPSDGRAPGRGDEWLTRDRVVHLQRRPRPEPLPLPVDAPLDGAVPPPAGR